MKRAAVMSHAHGTKFGGPWSIWHMNPNEGTEAVVERVDLLSRVDEARALLCSFFWSDKFGLRCSVPHWLQELELTGIATAAGKVFPGEGRRFFDALQFLGLSAGEITAPRRVSASEAQLS